MERFKQPIFLLALLLLLPTAAQAQRRTLRGAPMKVQVTGTVPLPTGSATAANQTSILTELGDKLDETTFTGAMAEVTTLLQAIDDGKVEESTFTGAMAEITTTLNLIDAGKLEEDTWTAYTGEVTTSPVANTKLGRLKEIQTNTDNLTNWNESSRAKVNPISGQVGIAGGTGNDGATVPRVTLATDIGLPAGSNIIGNIRIDQTTPGTTNGVVVNTSALPSGAATATLQSTAITSNDTNFTAVKGLIGEVQASPTENTILDRLKDVWTILGGKVEESTFTNAMSEVTVSLIAIQAGTEVIVDLPEYFEDTDFVTGESPVTLDINTALSRNATKTLIINDGPGNFTYQLSNDGGSFGDAITLKSGEFKTYNQLSIDSVKITWGTDSAYRVEGL